MFLLPPTLAAFRASTLSDAPAASMSPSISSSNLCISRRKHHHTRSMRTGTPCSKASSPCPYPESVGKAQGGVTGTDLVQVQVISDSAALVAQTAHTPLQVFQQLVLFCISMAAAEEDRRSG